MLPLLTARIQSRSCHSIIHLRICRSRTSISRTQTLNRLLLSAQLPNPTETSRPRIHRSIHLPLLPTRILRHRLTNQDWRSQYGESPSSLFPARNQALTSSSESHSTPHAKTRSILFPTIPNISDVPSLSPEPTLTRPKKSYGTSSPIRKCSNKTRSKSSRTRLS